MPTLKSATIDRTDSICFVPARIDYTLSPLPVIFKDIPQSVKEYADELILNNWSFYSTKSSRICGMCYFAGVITISDKALTVATLSQKIWIISHEISHAYAGHSAGHGPLFMEWLKRICPVEHIHHELGYKPRNAMMAGILPADL